MSWADLAAVVAGLLLVGAVGVAARQATLALLGYLALIVVWAAAPLDVSVLGAASLAWAVVVVALKLLGGVLK